MARPREFDAELVMDAAMRRFWSQGFERTSVKELLESTGLTAASLYNAFGDKRALFRATLDRYIEHSIGARISRCEALPPREAIHAFLADVLHRSVADVGGMGCMVVNSALELAPHDGEYRLLIAATLNRIEAFFLRCLRRGQDQGTITAAQPAEALARHLLGVLMGLRVLARVRPEPDFLSGVVGTALAFLEAEKQV